LAKSNQRKNVKKLKTKKKKGPRTSMALACNKARPPAAVRLSNRVQKKVYS
jgi:hypothetical protein